jgi:transposase
MNDREFQTATPANSFVVMIMNPSHATRSAFCKANLTSSLGWHSWKQPAKNAYPKAIYYCLKQWKPPNTFLPDGRPEIDNNRAELPIKPFVIARKNFLFWVAPYGAKASAIPFSLIESAKERSEIN